jgi:hypothetical protein
MDASAQIVEYKKGLAGQPESENRLESTKAISKDVTGNRRKRHKALNTASLSPLYNLRAHTLHSLVQKLLGKHCSTI